MAGAGGGDVEPGSTEEAGRGARRKGAETAVAMADLRSSALDANVDVDSADAAQDADGSLNK